MRHICTLCVLLLLTAPAYAAETLDEKVYDPRQATPPASPVPTEPTAPSSPDVRVTPGQTAPVIQGGAQGDTIIVVPAAPSQTTPSQANTPKETPSIVVPPVPSVPAIPAIPTAPTGPVPVPPIPAIPIIPSIPEPPKAPETENKDIIVTPPVQPVTPEEKKQPPVPPTPKAEDKILTPADFLPTTPEKKEAEKAEAKPDPQKDKASPKPDTKKDPKKDSKPAPQKDKPTPEKKKGEALRIPPEAAQSGNMDFLEGCWKGRLSGRAGSDVIDNMGSRFCFDDKGKGKHFLYDPKRNETCVGSANGGIKADGTLRVDFDSLYCPSGETWYPQGDKYMTCRDGGNGAECKWYYKGKPKTTGPFHRD